MTVANYGKQWPWIASSCHFERMADENDSADTDSPARQTTGDTEGEGSSSRSSRSRLSTIIRIFYGTYETNRAGELAGRAGLGQRKVEQLAHAKKRAEASGNLCGSVLH